MDPALKSQAVKIMINDYIIFNFKKGPIPYYHIYHAIFFYLF